MPKLKGSGWIANFDFLKKNYGEDAVARVIARMDPADQDILNKPILPVSWGPEFTVFMRFILLADKIYGQNDFFLLKQAAAFHMQRDVGLYSLFFKVLTPMFIIQNLPKIWRQYFDQSGTPLIEKVQEKHVRLHLTEFKDMPEHHEKYHNGYFEEIFRKTGIRQFTISHPKCLGKKDNECIFEATWI